MIYSPEAVSSVLEEMGLPVMVKGIYYEAHRADTLAGIDLLARVVFGKTPLFQRIEWDGQVLTLQRAAASPPARVATRPQPTPEKNALPTQTTPYREVPDATS